MFEWNAFACSYEYGFDYSFGYSYSYSYSYSFGFGFDFDYSNIKGPHKQPLIVKCFGYFQNSKNI